MGVKNQTRGLFVVNPTIAEIFENHGFNGDQPIPFSKIEDSYSMQSAMRKLKGLDHVQVYKFVEKHLVWDIERDVEMRKKIREETQKNCSGIREDLKTFLLATDDQLNATHDKVIQISLVKVMNWFKENVTEKSNSVEK